MSAPPGLPPRAAAGPLTGHGVFHWVSRGWGPRALSLLSTLRTQLLLFLPFVIFFSALMHTFEKRCQDKEVCVHTGRYQERPAFKAHSALSLS